MTEVTVASEMRANVSAIEADEGELVGAGQELLVLEAMKTEIPVTAPQAGVVLRILVAAGDEVDERQPLVVLSV